MFQVSSHKIRGLLLRSGLSLGEVAQNAGINSSTLRRALRSDAPATPKIISKLSAVFGVEPEQILLEGGNSND